MNKEQLYRVESTWFDNFSAFWIINKETKERVALALGKTRDRAAVNCATIVRLLETSPSPLSGDAEKDKEIEKGNQAIKENCDLRKEIERLKGLIETAFIEGWRIAGNSPLSIKLNDFKKRFNL